MISFIVLSFANLDHAFPSGGAPSGGGSCRVGYDLDPLLVGRVSGVQVRLRKYTLPGISLRSTDYQYLTTLIDSLQAFRKVREQDNSCG